MKNSKWIIFILILVLGVFLIFNLKNKPKTTEQSLSLNNKNEQTFLIEGFPIDKVPLYKLNNVSSNKIFVNTDPINLSGFGENNFAYYNVVFYSDASQEEFLNYYKNLFESQIVEEFESPDMVKGIIGQYKVSAAHYGSGNTGYLQVHLADYKDESINKYFLDFPDVLEINSSLVEHEKSYGLLNQKGGEIEYTKYFTVVDSGDQNNDGSDDVDEFLLLEEEYKKEHKDKVGYAYDEKTGTMKWNDKEFEVTLAISRDHGRIYLMLRKGLDK
ncbi:MAG: hypothetical protein WDA13_02520 [Candidatus Shapirobacteria bacterium]